MDINIEYIDSCHIQASVIEDNKLIFNSIYEQIQNDTLIKLSCEATRHLTMQETFLVFKTLKNKTGLVINTAYNPIVNDYHFIFPKDIMPIINEETYNYELVFNIKTCKICIDIINDKYKTMIIKDIIINNLRVFLNQSDSKVDVDYRTYYWVVYSYSILQQLLEHYNISHTLKDINSIANKVIHNDDITTHATSLSVSEYELYTTVYINDENSIPLIDFDFVESNDDYKTFSVTRASNMKYANRVVCALLSWKHTSDFVDIILNICADFPTKFGGGCLIVSTDKLGTLGVMCQTNKGQYSMYMDTLKNINIDIYGNIIDELPEPLRYIYKRLSEGI